MPEALKLYHAPTSPNSRRVRMFLAEKGISLPLVSIDLAAGEQHGDAYRAIESAPCRSDSHARRRHGDRRGSGHLALSGGGLPRQRRCSARHRRTRRW